MRKKLSIKSEGCVTERSRRYHTVPVCALPQKKDGKMLAKMI